MSFENTKCPCGGKKEPQTMLCQECVDHISSMPEATFDLKHYNDSTYHLSTRRSMAIRLLGLAHRRKSRGSLPLAYSV